MQQGHVSDTSVDTNLQIKTHVVDIKTKDSNETSSLRADQRSH